MTFNNVLAAVVVLGSFSLFYLIILKGIGGTEALFGILGYISGALSTIMAFYYRKRIGEK